MNNIYPRVIGIMLVMLATAYTPSLYAEQKISLPMALTQAIKNDPWLRGNKLSQQAVQARQVAAGSLPDPKVTIGLLNLPSENGHFNQEAMTQFKVGVSQTFARGNELELKQSQLRIEHLQFSFMYNDRIASLTKEVSRLWFEVYSAQQTVKLIEKNKQLFIQMVELAQASYAAGLDKTKHQDVIRAQLELLQLEDMLVIQTQKLDIAKSHLREWLDDTSLENTKQMTQFERSIYDFSVSPSMPSYVQQTQQLIQNSMLSYDDMLQIIMRHPSVKVFELKYQMAKKGVAIAHEKYKPQWGVNASYGYRASAPTGEDRADLFSVGISFDLPLFTQNRQDKELSASVASAEAVKTEQLLLMKKLLAGLTSEIARLNNLTARKSLYKDKLLLQNQEQADVTLTAYTHDDGFLSDVIRARIAQLNAQIVALEIDTQIAQTIARINYYLSSGKSNEYTVLEQG